MCSLQAFLMLLYCLDNFTTTLFYVLLSLHLRLNQGGLLNIFMK